MTCIVALVDKEQGVTVMGGDSAATSESSRRIITNPKVFRRGAFVFGCTSSFRMIQLLQFSLVIPDINQKEVFKYMCTDFINEVRRCFKEGGFLVEENGEQKDGSFLVAYKDRLFRIEEDFNVSETINGMDAIGCGEDLALGALHVLRNIDITIEQKIERALEVAAEYSIGVNSPFVLREVKHS